MSDPSIGRFWQVDPLADDYVYNSTYAFQENKLGMGVELEGLELSKKFKAGIKQLKQGIQDLFNNETGGELKRRIESGKTQNAARKEELQQEKLANKTEALGNIAEGTSESAKRGAQVVGTALERAGEGVTAVGIVTAQPEIIAAGETISTTGTVINATVDYLDGKPVIDIALESSASVVVGASGKKIVKLAKKSGDESKTSEAIIKGTEKVLEGATKELIIPAVQERAENEQENK